jgi:hypothetical protein
LLTNIFTSPNSFIAFYAASLIYYLFETSSLMQKIFSAYYLKTLFSFLINSFVSISPCSFISHKVRLAPSFENLIAIPRPSPDPAPVINICLFLTLFFLNNPFSLANV